MVRIEAKRGEADRAKNKTANCVLCRDRCTKNAERERCTLDRIGVNSVKNAVIGDLKRLETIILISLLTFQDPNETNHCPSTPQLDISAICTPKPESRKGVERACMRYVRLRVRARIMVWDTR